MHCTLTQSPTLKHLLMLTTLRYIFSPRLPPLRRVPVCSSSMSKRRLTKVPRSCCITASPTRLEVSPSASHSGSLTPTSTPAEIPCRLSRRKSSPLSTTLSWAGLSSRRSQRHSFWAGLSTLALPPTVYPTSANCRGLNPGPYAC